MELIANTVEELDWIVNRCSSAKYIRYIPKKHKLDPNTFEIMVSFDYVIELSAQDYTMWALRYAGKEEKLEYFYEDEMTSIQEIVNKIKKSFDEKNQIA
jgi:hypothetical protein